MSMAPALPAGRQGQRLALGLVVLSAIVLWLGVVAPLIDWYDSRAAQLEHEQALAERLARVAAELPVLRQRAAEGTAETSTANTIEGASDALAAAHLQDLVQGLASDAQANLASVEVLSSVPAGTYRRIGLKIGLTATYPVLVDLLSKIELSPTAMLVDDLEIQGDLGADAPPDSSLQVGFTVYAFRAGDSK